MRTFRVFISSPGDTSTERRRVESVVSRLNGEFAGLARLTTIRWETDSYGAHDTFQAQIPPSVECDVVVGILRWRLGTELPLGFEVQPGGEPYPSGTAYELLTAIGKRKAGGDLPDVFVFRYTGSPPSIVIGDAEETAKRRDWTALQGFFARWFITEQGHFTAALNTYGSEDDLEQQVETLLRKWMAERVAGGRVVPWPAVKGSPFRGLDVFGTRHTPVFFGRANDIRRATDLWRDAAVRGCRFLLLVGASGAGKSSLVRAGLVPRLVTPGVVAEVDLWRVAVVRPADSPDGPFMALAAALLRAEADLPPEEEGRGPALPEIAEGDSKTPADLAAVLAHADAGATRVVANALARVGERWHVAEHYHRPVRCDLVLVLDQAEELFAPSVSPAVRERFAALLETLAASGRVWVAATLRADSYASLLDVPRLKALKDKGASYDLAPPNAAELADIVRAPAAAADLAFDIDPATGRTLDEILLHEADRPDMLPLVQLALSRLWEARETRGAETVLLLAAFRTLGGLKGIIAEAGEAALSRCDATLLPPLMRRLAELSQGRGGVPGTLTARAVPFGEAAPNPAARALVDALVEARLLTLSDEAGVTVRLAHQRVLSDWPAAAAIVADSADFYRVRDEVEAQQRRWEGSWKRGDLLLPRGLPLAEARAMVAKYVAELPPETLAYVAASRRRANRAQVVAWSAAAVFLLVAIGAGVEWRTASGARAVAEEQRQAAERSLGIAKAAIDGLVFDIAQGLGDVGLPVATTKTILETARQTVDRLLSAAPDDRGLERSRSGMLLNFGTTYLTEGDLKDAFPALQESLDIARKLAAQDPGNAQAQRDMSASLISVGDAKLQSGDGTGALAAYQESLDIRRELSARDPGNAQAERDLSLSLSRVGDVTLRSGDGARALAAYQESLDIFRKLAAQDPGNFQDQRYVSLGLEGIGNVKLQSGDTAGALAAYQESLGIDRKLATQNPGNTKARRNLSISLKKIGDVKLRSGDTAGALAAYQESLGIDRMLAAQDPDNAQAERDLSLSLESVGDAKQSGDSAGALAAYQERLAIARKLAALNPGNAQGQRDVWFSLMSIGDVELGYSGNGKMQLAAYADYGESLVIAQKLAEQDPHNAQAQRDVSASLERIGDVRLRLNQGEGAILIYQESLDIRRKLVAQDPNNTQAMGDVFIILTKIASNKLKLYHQEAALSLFKEAVAIAERLAAQDPTNAQAKSDLVWVRRQSASIAGDSK